MKKKIVFDKIKYTYIHVESDYSIYRSLKRFKITNRPVAYTPKMTFSGSANNK